MSESIDECVSRLKCMAEEDSKWDLSYNDRKAIWMVIDSRERLKMACDEFTAVSEGEVSFKDGKMVASLKSRIHLVFAEAFYDLVIDSGAKNYLEVTFQGERGNILMHLQRLDGETPHNMRVKAQAWAKAWKKAAKRYRMLCLSNPMNRSKPA